MLRQFSSAIIFTSISVPAFAAQIEGEALTSHVTVFPQGAVIEWQVDIDAEPGRHDLLLSDIPRNIDPQTIRLTGEGATIGTVSLQSQPPTPGEQEDPQTVTDARNKVKQAQEELTRLANEIAAREMAAKAWRGRADMVRGDARIAANELDTLANSAGDLISDYLTKSADESREAQLMSHQHGALQRNLEKAEAVLADLVQTQEQSQKLLVTLEQTAPTAKLKLTAYTDQAGWAPAYDLDLTRETGALAMKRSLTVWQGSGNDWQDVTLTFSTARPRGQSSPTEVPPYIVEFYDDYARDKAGSVIGRALSEEPASGYVAPVVDVEPVVMESDFAAGAELANIGMTVTYDYKTPVTVHNETDALRLSLDEKALKTEVLAEASPRYDSSAYVVAEGVNDMGEAILPGRSNLYLDGALVGQGDLPLTATGDDLHIGFGPIDAITAELQTPEEETGESGFINRQNQRVQTETLIVRNLTGEEWPLRVVDRAPVSKQEDLQVSWSANPSPSEENPDGRRGVLYWEAPIKSGETMEIELTTDIRWPEGKVVDR